MKIKKLSILSKSIITGLFLFTNCIITHLYGTQEYDNNSINLIANNINNNILTKIHKKKNETTTVGIYIAADNDLFPFAGRNIKQMQNIGSNDKLNLVVHFNMHKTGGKKISKRFLVKKNKLMQVGPDFSADSGNIKTLLDFCKWQIENFPADNQVLILWNHGTGIIEPNLRKAINPSQLFNYNHHNKLIELNRNIGFIDYINSQLQTKTPTRGICFDDTTRNYLTIRNLKDGLETISKDYLKGKKLALLACDACLMSMIEVISPIKEYADYFVSSQEVVLGTGYDYTKTLEPFINTHITKEQFVQHIVQTYKETYGKITNDYTQSAINLSKIHLLEDNITQVSQILIKALDKQNGNSLKEVIKLSKHKNFCTHFDEPTYIDLGHFYQNLLNNLSKCNLKNSQETNDFKLNLKKLLIEGITIINNAVIANAVGKNLKNATGISIYFPENRIHNSYNQSEFANKTKWGQFLKKYVNS